MTVTDPAMRAPLTELIACPHCDAVYHVGHAPDSRHRAVCARCHTVLIAPHRRAGKRIIALAVSVLILVGAAMSFPFLKIRAGGVTNSSSLVDAALAFAGGPLMVLSLAVAAAILFVPVLRVLLVLYVLLPVVRDRPPWPGARQAFRLSETLRPWSMAEIFALGCAVALVKVADLAQVVFGPAFWIFAVLVVIVVVQDNYMCRWSVWKSLEKS